MFEKVLSHVDLTNQFSFFQNLLAVWISSFPATVSSNGVFFQTFFVSSSLFNIIVKFINNFIFNTLCEADRQSGFNFVECGFLISPSRYGAERFSFVLRPRVFPSIESIK